MPELPEVENVIRYITKHSSTSRIRSFDCKGVCLDQRDRVEEKLIQSVSRRGKYIIFSLEEGYLISHLRMTGQWFFTNERPDDKYFRWGFELSKDGKSTGHLWFRDIRKFGTLEYMDSLEDYKPFRLLGPDGLGLNNPEAIEFVKKKLAKSSKPIKNILLDQSVIAGPGNIYVNELLWHLKINPGKESKNCLDRTEDICSLFTKLFEDAIECGGCSVSDYLGGTYQHRLNVYGKEGEPCPRECGSKISRIVQSGRSTFYCSNCQI